MCSRKPGTLATATSESHSASQLPAREFVHFRRVSIDVIFAPESDGQSSKESVLGSTEAGRREKAVEPKSSKSDSGVFPSF